MDPLEPDCRFPRSAKYSHDWISENGFGANPLWQTEWLCESLTLEPGMRVLDLGCGRAKSSIFLAREFDVEVWATDLWITASENLRRVRDADLENRVYPLHSDARSLPFAGEFFDAIVMIDCFSYFGTDDLYLNYLANFVKPGGLIGMAGAGLMQEMPQPIPEHLTQWWSQDCWCLHSPPWWQHHWGRTGLIELQTADTMEDGWKYWCHWHKKTWPDSKTEIAALEVDAGRNLGYVRMVGRRRSDVKLEDYAWPDGLRSFPPAYEKKNMLRDLG